MPDDPRVVFQAPSAAAAEQARGLLAELGIQPVAAEGDPLLIWVAPQDYGAAATLLDEAFPPEGGAPPPAAVVLDDSDEAQEPPPDDDEAPAPGRHGRRRLPAAFKVGTIAVFSAFLPWLGSVFAVFALLAALWLLVRKRTPGRWIALELALLAVAWQAFLFSQAGE